MMGQYNQSLRLCQKGGVKSTAPAVIPPEALANLSPEDRQRLEERRANEAQGGIANIPPDIDSEIMVAAVKKLKSEYYWSVFWKAIIVSIFASYIYSPYRRSA